MLERAKRSAGILADIHIYKPYQRRPPRRRCRSKVCVGKKGRQRLLRKIGKIDENGQSLRRTFWNRLPQTPQNCGRNEKAPRSHDRRALKLVAEEGFEPPTHGLWFHCSNQLSYSAINKALLNILSSKTYIRERGRVYWSQSYMSSACMIFFWNI